MQSWRATADKLFVTLKDNTVAKFSTLWLLDHQQANWHVQTQQKIKPASDLPLHAPQIKHVEQHGNVLQVDFDQQESIKVDISKPQLITSNRSGLRKKTAWNKLDPFPTSLYGDKHSQKQMLSNLCEYGVHLVKQMPNTSQLTEQFIRTNFGPPRETLYGGMWDTAPRKENVNDTAYTFDALDPHTDCCYLIDSPGLQCFNCVAQDQQGGGYTRLVDSEYVLQQLKHTHHDTFVYFATKKFTFHHTEPGLEALHYAPVIDVQGGSDGEIVQFRYNEYDLHKLPLEDENDVDLFYKHNRVLIAALKANEMRIKLEVGDMLVLDNHRVLHGRTAFTGYRNLIGCYVGVDDWMMRARAQLKVKD